MLRDLRWVSLAEVLSRFGSVVTVPLLTRALVPADYGLYKSVFTAFSLFLVIEGVLNLDILLQKRVPERGDESRRSLLPAASLLALVALLVAVGILAVATVTELLTILSPAVQQFVAANFGIVAVLLVVTALHRLGFSVLKSTDAFTAYSVVRTVRELFVLAVVVAGFLLDILTVERVLLIYIAANTLVVVTVFVRLRDRFLSPPAVSDLVTQLRAVSLPLAPKPFLKKAQSQLPDLLVLSAFGTTVFGQWSVVFALMGLIAVLNKPVTQLLLPKLSGRLDRGEPVGPIVITYYRLLLLLALPIAVGGALVGPQIIQHAFGAGYVPSAIVVVVLLIGFAVKPVAALSGYFYIATDRSELETMNSVLGAAVYFGGALLGTLVLDSLVIVAVAFTMQYVVRLVVSLAYQRRHVTFARPELPTVASVTLALAVMGGAVMLTKGRITGLLSLSAVIGGGAGVYFSVLWTTGFFSDRDVELLRRFIGVE